MQTFLVTPRYVDTATLLDYRRLGKQRVEAWQILRALAGLSKGWTNHPAVKMWEGYEYSLGIYGSVMCTEWARRGYTDNMRERFVEVCRVTPNTGRPDWTTNESFHLSHKSNLVRKMPEFYGPLFPGVPDDLPYLWPSDNLVRI